MTHTIVKVIYPYSLQKHDVTMTKKGGKGYGISKYTLNIFVELVDNELSSCTPVVGVPSVRGLVRVWLAGGIGPEVSLTSVVSVNVSGMLKEEILPAIDTVCDEFAKNTEAKFVRKRED